MYLVVEMEFFEKKQGYLALGLFTLFSSVNVWTYLCWLSFI